MPKPPPGPDWSVPPSGWGARVDYDSWQDPWYPKEGIAIHHGGGGDYPAHKPPYTVEKEAAQLRAWENYHIDGRGWRGIAYNWAVGMTGTVYRLRGWNNNGAHLGDIDSDGIPNNREIFGVLFIMSGSLVSPSPDMINSFENLREYLEATLDIDLFLWGHKEIQPDKPTSCPGIKNMPYITTHRISEGEAMNVTRLAGFNRYATAALISQRVFPNGAPVAYVATGTNFPDGMAAGTVTDGPILLTHPMKLSPETQAELLRLNPGEVVILGGPDVVSAEVERAIADL